MVRRSPQKKSKPGTPKPGNAAAAAAEVAASQGPGAGAQGTTNWWSTDAAPSLAPDPEPWKTPTGHGKAGGDWGRSPLRSPTKPLEQQVASLQAQRDAANTDLWDARVELQQHAGQKDADRNRISKLTAEVARLRADHEHNSQSVDELRSREIALQSRLDREHAKAVRDRETAREQLEERDGFIESLQSQLEDLRSQLKAAASAATQLRRQTEEDTLDDASSGVGDFTSLSIDLDNDPDAADPTPPTGVPQTVGANELLSQSHQARQQRALRGALQKQRLENLQLRQQLAELRGASASSWHESDDDDEYFSPSDSSAAVPDTSRFLTSEPLATISEIPAGGFPLSEDFTEAGGEDAEGLDGSGPEAELRALQNKHGDAASLETMTAHLRQKYDAHVVPSEEFEALHNPGVELLHNQAHAINHRLVTIQEYEELRNARAVADKLKLSDDELKLAYDLFRGRRKTKTGVKSHVLQDLARQQALGLSPEVTRRYSDASSRATGHQPHQHPHPHPHHSRSISHSSTISDSGSGFGESLGEDVGAAAALRQIALNHGFELVADTASASRELARRHGLEAVPVEKLAVLSESRIIPDSTVLNSHADEVILALSRADAERIQQQLSLPDITADKVSELQRRAYSPTQADLNEQAAALGLAVLPLESVAEMTGNLRQRSIPDASTIADMAQKAGLRVISEHPSLEELRDLAPEDAVLVERETWAALDHPDPATLTRLAKTHGLIVLPETEIEALRKRAKAEAANENDPSTPLAARASAETPDFGGPLSAEELKEQAQALDLVVLSSEDYRTILSSKHTRDFSHLPMAARKEHFENLIKSSQESRSSATSPREGRSPAASSLGSLSDRITRLGFVPVEQEEYHRLLASQKVYEPTKSDVLRSAKQFGLATMSLEDYQRWRNTQWNSPTKSRDDSGASSGSPRNRRSDAETEEVDGEFQTVPVKYLAALRRIVEQPQQSDVENLAKKVGIKLNESLTDEQLIERAKKIGLSEPLSDDELLAAARLRGLVDPPSDDDIVVRAKKLGLSEELTEGSIRERAGKLGLVPPLSEPQILEAAKSLGLREPPDDTQIIARAETLGLSKTLTDEQIIERAKALGLAEPLSEAEILVSGRELGLVDPLTDSEIIERAKALGLVDPISEPELIAAAKTKGLIDPPSDADITQRATLLGLVAPPTHEHIIEAALAKGLIHPPTDDEFANQAKARGFTTPLSDDEVVGRAESLGLIRPLSLSEIIEKAKTHGLIEKPSDDAVLQSARQLGLVEPLAESDIVEKAKKLGLVDALSDKEILGRAKELGLAEPYSDAQTLEKAKQLGLVEPHTDDMILDRAKQLGLIEPHTDAQTLEKAKQLGLVEPHTDAQTLEKAKQLGLIEPHTDDMILDRAKQLGLIEPHTDAQTLEKAKQLGLIEPHTDDMILDRAKQLGLIEPHTDAQTLEKAKQLGLIEPHTDDMILERARQLGLVNASSDTEILERARELGLVEPFSDAQTLKKAKQLGLIEPLSDGMIREKAKQLGLIEPYTDEVILEKAKAMGLATPLSDSDTLSRAKELGLVEALSDIEILEKAKHLGLAEPLSHAQIVAKANELGLAEPLTDDALLLKAKQLGLVEAYSDAAISARARELGLVDVPSDSQILARARELGLVEPQPAAVAEESTGIPLAAAASVAQSDKKRSSPTADVETESHARSPSTSEVPSDAAAASIKPRELDVTHDSSKRSSVTRKPVASTASGADSTEGTAADMHAATSNTPVASPPVPERIRADLGSESVRTFGSIPILAPGSATSASNGEPLVTYGAEGPGQVTSLGLPQRLGGSPGRRTTARYEVHTTPRSKSPTRPIPRSATTGSLHNYQRHGTHGSISSTGGTDVAGLPMPPRRGPAHHGLHSRYTASIAESTGSSWGVETISEDRVGLSVSQVMVGEVLYKYTSGFQIEGLTGGRHKRYFWFRPESRTLYWHRENPHIFASFFGPAKSITVISVDEVIDRNPIPAGLFHRSIIIKGRERDLRITCPTASRHQIWYGVLRHILKEQNATALAPTQE